MNGNSGRVNTDSGKMNSDSGHGAKSWYFPPEYAFTQNQKLRSRSARIPGHAGPEYAIANVAGAGALGTASLVDPTAFEAMLKVNILALTRLSITDRVQL
ncbi:hypothetical protein ORL43_26245 [Klebsiella michiganensis]|nr:MULTISPECIES: hypothetical protein [Klebsiella]HDS3618639.1 hypothetical protein [Klebsiella pneumoniae subsp. pneumoniae]EKX4126999.1 hypothetical protein [Klebsiella pneumoniae]MCQ0577398.1 hypothetical protein [Klebsiella pneumoniae]MCW9468693.1 hypothetical protein [Klebsiella michiganensis]MCW9616961.1 hypothetical protein [Klebsiella michiganensis]